MCDILYDSLCSGVPAGAEDFSVEEIASCLSGICDRNKTDDFSLKFFKANMNDKVEMIVNSNFIPMN